MPIHHKTQSTKRSPIRRNPPRAKTAFTTALWLLLRRHPVNEPNFRTNPYHARRLLDCGNSTFRKLCNLILDCVEYLESDLRLLILRSLKCNATACVKLLTQVQRVDRMAFVLLFHEGRTVNTVRWVKPTVSTIYN